MRRGSGGDGVEDALGELVARRVLAAEQWSPQAPPQGSYDPSTRELRLTSVLGEPLEPAWIIVVSRRSLRRVRATRRRTRDLAVDHLVDELVLILVEESSADEPINPLVF